MYFRLELSTQGFHTFKSFYIPLRTTILNENQVSLEIPLQNKLQRKNGKP